MVMLGDTFPSIEVQTTQGMKNLPQDYAGKWLVLFSHPGDFTPVCTTEFVTFSQKDPNFKTINAELMGLSVDSLDPHFKWLEWIEENAGIKVPFPVIADPLGMVSKKLGMIAPKKGARTVRKVFIVDPQGIVRLTITYPPEVGRNVDEILRALHALQTVDKYKMVAQENYPSNAWLGSALLLPPPKSEQEIMARESRAPQNGYECKDWWFCYKDMT